MEVRWSSSSEPIKSNECVKCKQVHKLKLILKILPQDPCLTKTLSAYDNKKQLGFN